MSEHLDWAMSEWNKGKSEHQAELIEEGYLEVHQTAKGYLGLANTIRCSTPDIGERNCIQQRMDEMGWCENCQHRNWLMEKAKEA